eukprot:3213756-Pyramimonas_sp.AAC.1
MSIRQWRLGLDLSPLIVLNALNTRTVPAQPSSTRSVPHAATCASGPAHASTGCAVVRSHLSPGTDLVAV